MPELTFDPDKHEYRLDGVLIPNVTTVLQSVGMVDYSCIDRDVLEYAQTRGTYIHQATALYDENDLDEEKLSKSLKPYVEAWKLFRQQSDFIPGEIEQKKHHATYLYAGTADRAGSIHGKPAIVDIKPPFSKPWWQIQTAAYALMWFPNVIAFRMAVSLHPDGSYRIHRHVDARDKQIWLSALAVHNWKTNHKGGC